MIFYSQRDPRWRWKKLGQSNCTVDRYGCTTSCISMGGSWFKEEKDPGFLAQNLTYTKDGLIIWQSIEKVYKNMKFLWRFGQWNEKLKRFNPYDPKLIDEALKNPNKVVLLNVDRGYHWVFLLNKVPILGYRCVDPYQFPAKVRYYKPSEVVGGTILNRK